MLNKNKKIDFILKLINNEKSVLYFFLESWFLISLIFLLIKINDHFKQVNIFTVILILLMIIFIMFYKIKKIKIKIIKIIIKMFKINKKIENFVINKLKKIIKKEYIKLNTKNPYIKYVPESKIIDIINYIEENKEELEKKYEEEELRNNLSNF